MISDRPWVQAPFLLPIVHTGLRGVLKGAQSMPRPGSESSGFARVESSGHFPSHTITADWGSQAVPAGLIRRRSLVQIQHPHPSHAGLAQSVERPLDKRGGLVRDQESAPYTTSVGRMPWKGGLNTDANPEGRTRRNEYKKRCK